jgi:hypothetical protein
MNPDNDAVRVGRRAVLAALAAAGSSLAVGGGCAPVQPAATGAAAAVPARQSAALTYLATLARPDGGFAWADQAQSHLTPTYAVIGSYRLLKQQPPNPKGLAAFVRAHHPSRLKKLEQEHRVFAFQQVQALVWLGDDAADFRERILAWKQPLAYLKQYERHGYPVFSSEISGAFACRELLGLPLGDLPPPFVEYLDARRRGNGSFNNTPAADGGDGHVVNTAWGLQALRALGRADEMRAETAAWLTACQLPGGGFTYQPTPELGGVDDVAYTRAAARSLQLLGGAPDRPEACAAYVDSLFNADGGFADRPGWLSNPMATYYALDTLDALGVLDGWTKDRSKARVVSVSPPPLPAGLKVFSAQIEAHGQGSPAEAVELAAALRIHLWGAKNAKPGWLAAAQAVADRQNVPVRFFASNEEYGTWVNVPGLGTYSHTSDVVAPAAADFGAPLSNQGVVSWPEFRQRRLRPLEKAGGRLIWQFGENEELVRIYLDDSLTRARAGGAPGGYAAISTFHFGNPDFTNTEPFLQRWRGQIPFVALQDAHGAEPWWFADMTAGFRTLFLAAEPTWNGFLEALRRNWVVAVRHDAVSGQQTWMHGGSDRVVNFVKEREADWRWWDNPAVARPMVSVVAVRPGDRFEAARPTRGVTLRVRCAWENSAQGLLRAPITELVRLTVDGAAVAPVLVATKAPRGALLADHYHRFDIAEPAPGKHSAEAVVRMVNGKVELRRAIEFTA